MKSKIIESVSLADINYEQIYFNPGCALSIYKLDAELKLLAILQQYFPKMQMHNICCHHDPNLPKGSTIVNNCAGCDRRFRSLYEGVNTITIWELLDSLSTLELPQYKGLCVSVHDSCSFRQKPQVYEFQKKRAAQMPCEDVVVYCVSCIKAMKIGNKTPHHLVDLLLNEPTEPQELDLVLYHETVDEYIKCH